MISGDLPRNREAWPEAVVEAAAQFVCGDVVASPPFFYFADPEHGVMTSTRAYLELGYSGPEVIQASDLAADYGLITTQTCDLGELEYDPPTKPFISVAPIYDMSETLDKSIQSLLRQGKRIQGWLHVPALTRLADGFWVVDLRIEMPIEKSWLVGRTPIKGFETEEGAQRVGELGAEMRTRPAWATAVSDVLQGALQESLKLLKGQSRDLFIKVVEEIDEVGIRADSALSPRWVQLCAFVSAEKHDLSDGVERWWNTVNDKLRPLMASQGVDLHDNVVRCLCHTSVAEYRSFVPAQLTRFSPR